MKKVTKVCKNCKSQIQHYEIDYLEKCPFCGHDKLKKQRGGKNDQF